jgi:hypothetical protein
MERATYQQEWKRLGRRKVNTSPEVTGMGAYIVYEEPLMLNDGLRYKYLRDSV